ncbi:M18 family aminopeptidase [Larsenimonas salina]|uniref:M18 family aminopeptidase n=1 Tax=Larsenimonas salina TaxID=1295565 RepID=UPI0020741F84|nr:M18 family aminopeptidase [Larsenimonas salina]MCM5703069.1 M18 family aminopeptidase [Larsenimonas salina]
MVSVSQVQDQLCEFLDASPTAWHATRNMTDMLARSGYQALDERSAWTLTPGGRYYVTRNDSAVIAFQVPTGELDGFRMMGAHTDSPCLRLKSDPVQRSRDWLQFGVEVYGGALLAPWFDRDLGLAGRVHVRRSNGKVEGILINTNKPIAIIPSLAIHMDREANQNRSFNAQTQMAPVVWQGAFTDDNPLLSLIKTQAGTDIDAILGHELCLYDTQPAGRIGGEDGLIASARLDNLLSCFCTTSAMAALEGDQAVLMVANDHEEVGSASASGAQGSFLRDVLSRLNESSVGRGGSEGFVRMIQSSCMVSCDNAHALHPNYPDKHDRNHGPAINGGPVIKINASQRYATNSATEALFRDACERADVPVQSFVTRADMGCGSTIGPITATELGIPTLDVGLSQWAMHSVRETTGARDPAHLIAALGAFCTPNE